MRAARRRRRRRGALTRLRVGAHVLAQETASAPVSAATRIVSSTTSPSRTTSTPPRWRSEASRSASAVEQEGEPIGRAERASSVGSNTNSGTTVLGRRDRGGERRLVVHAQVAREEHDGRAHGYSAGEPERTTGDARRRQPEEIAIAIGLGLRTSAELRPAAANGCSAIVSDLRPRGARPGADDLTVDHDDRPEHAVGARHDLVGVLGREHGVAILVAEHVLVEAGEQERLLAPAARRRLVGALGGEPVLGPPQTRAREPAGVAGPARVAER